MKSQVLILTLFLAIGCQTETELPLDGASLAFERNAEIWKQKFVRYPETGQLISVSDQDAVKLQISEDNVYFITSTNSCSGKITGDRISLEDCYYQSPEWVIVEKSDDKMYIYPRMGSMYYYDLVLVKVRESCEVSCNLEPLGGMCKAAIPRYYFDKIDGKCKEFIWGGCGGVVPFVTFEECEACECKTE